MFRQRFILGCGLIGLSLVASTSFASAVSVTKITQVLAGPVNGNKVFVVLSVKPASQPACQSNPNFSYVFDASTAVGKVVLSMVLTAHTTQQDVYIDGDDTCSLHGSVESLRQVWLK